VEDLVAGAARAPAAESALARACLESDRGLGYNCAVSQPTRSEVEQLLDDCWGKNLRQGPLHMRVVAVDHLTQLAVARGYDASSAERLADAIVEERGGSRHTVHDPARLVRNLGNRLTGRPTAAAEYVWQYPRTPPPETEERQAPAEEHPL
jgi:hypothetical protein